MRAKICIDIYLIYYIFSIDSKPAMQWKDLVRYPPFTSTQENLTMYQKQGNKPCDSYITINDSLASPQYQQKILKNINEILTSKEFERKQNTSTFKRARNPLLSLSFTKFFPLDNGPETLQKPLVGPQLQV